MLLFSLSDLATSEGGQLSFSLDSPWLTHQLTHQLTKNDPARIPHTCQSFTCGTALALCGIISVDSRGHSAWSWTAEGIEPFAVFIICIFSLFLGLLFPGAHFPGLPLRAAIVRCHCALPASLWLHWKLGSVLFGACGVWSWKLQCPTKESPMAWFSFDNPRLHAGLQSFVFFFPALISAWLSRHIFGT